MVEPVAAERARGAGQQEHGRTAGHFFDLRGRRVDGVFLSFFALVIVASMACCRGAQYGSSASRSASSHHDCCGYAAYLCICSPALSGFQMRRIAAFARLRCMRKRRTTFQSSMMHLRTLIWASSSYCCLCAWAKTRPEVVLVGVPAGGSRGVEGLKARVKRSRAASENTSVHT